MAENEIKDVELEDDLVEEIEEKDDTDWKAEALKARGIAKRYKTDLTKLKQAKVEVKTETPEKPSEKVEKTSFDYAEMAYLEAKQVSDEEYPIVLEAMRSTGKSLRDTLNSKYVQAELKEIRETKASKTALPAGSKRTGTPSRDTAEYHIAKGTPINEIEDVKVRREVVRLKAKGSPGGKPAFITR